jgi:hypothetical protein
MPVFTETAAPTNLNQIENIEKLTGLKFPIEYKEHLLRYNGGRCTPNVFSFKENEEFPDSMIDWFLAIYEGEYDNLLKYIEIYKIDDKRLPTHMLRIAHDPGGNLVCISCGPDDYGYVYFWDHEKEVDYSVSDDNDYSNLYLISKSFTQFLNELKD